MEYKENMLYYKDYYRLRESVHWANFSADQTQKALNNSLYSVIAVENNQTIGMGRLIGDGLYYLIVDIIVHPAHQRNGVGSKILNQDVFCDFLEIVWHWIYAVRTKSGETYYQSMPSTFSIS